MPRLLDAHCSCFYPDPSATVAVSLMGENEILATSSNDGVACPSRGNLKAGRQTKKGTNVSSGGEMMVRCGKVAIGCNRLYQSHRPKVPSLGLKKLNEWLSAWPYYCPIRDTDVDLLNGGAKGGHYCFHEGVVLQHGTSSTSTVSPQSTALVMNQRMILVKDLLTQPKIHSLPFVFNRRRC